MDLFILKYEFQIVFLLFFKSCIKLALEPLSLNKFASVALSMNKLVFVPDNLVLHGLELEIEVNEDYSRSEKAQTILNAIGTYRDDKNNGFTYCLAEDATNE